MNTAAQVQGDAAPPRAYSRLEDLAAALKERGARRILITGPRRCGKTTLSELLRDAGVDLPVLHTDALLLTHSTVRRVGAPNDAERAELLAGRFMTPYQPDSALLREVGRWMTRPAWMIEGAPAAYAFLRRMRLRQAVGAQAAILCETPQAALPGGWQAQRDQLCGLWDAYEPVLASLGVMQCRWTPAVRESGPGAVAGL